MSEIIKIFNGIEIKTTDSFIEITWDELLPFMKTIARLREGEIINGIITSDAGMRVVLGKKRIRKTKNK